MKKIRKAAKLLALIMAVQVLFTGCTIYKSQLVNLPLESPANQTFLVGNILKIKTQQGQRIDHFIIKSIDGNILCGEMRTYNKDGQDRLENTCVDVTKFSYLKIKQKDELSSTIVTLFIVTAVLVGGIVAIDKTTPDELEIQGLYYPGYSP